MESLKRIGNNVLTRVLVIGLVVSFLLFFFENVQTTYNLYTDLEKEIELPYLLQPIVEAIEPLSAALGMANYIQSYPQNEPIQHQTRTMPFGRFSKIGNWFFENI